MASEWYRSVGPFRVVTSEAGAEATAKIQELDPSVLTEPWGAIVVQRTDVGWSWRTISSQAPGFVDLVASYIGGPEIWALLRGSAPIDALLADTAQKIEAFEREESARIARSKRDAREFREKIWCVSVGAAVGTLVLWGWWRSDKTQRA